MTDEQKRVYLWMTDTLSCPGYAAAYRVAMTLLAQQPPGYATLVAHVGRDLMNGLAPAVRGISRRQTQYHQYLDRIQASWNNTWRTNHLTHKSGQQSHHSIPSHICDEISNLVDEHQTARDRNNQTDALFFTTFYEYIDIQSVPHNIARQWKDARSFFQGRAHFTESALCADREQEVNENFQKLHTLLHVAAANAYQRLKGIHDILAIANS